MSFRVESTQLEFTTRLAVDVERRSITPNSTRRDAFLRVYDA